MIRSLRLVLLLWAFVVVPTLCPAGVLVHACHEEEETTSCAHEDDCDVDPCLQASALSERPAMKNLVAPALLVTPTAIPIVSIESSLDEMAATLHLGFAHANAAPFPPGAQPLLI